MARLDLCDPKNMRASELALLYLIEYHKGDTDAMDLLIMEARRQGLASQVAAYVNEGIQQEKDFNDRWTATPRSNTDT